jgi:DNA-binding NarL/FixJ family response regulator
MQNGFFTRKETSMKLPKLTEPIEELTLTRRENEVIRGFAKGRLNKEIADELGLSFSAVHKHQYNIFRKLQVNNRTEAAIKWMLIERKVL